MGATHFIDCFSIRRSRRLSSQAQTMRLHIIVCCWPRFNDFARFHFVPSIAHLLASRFRINFFVFCWKHNSIELIMWNDENPLTHAITMANDSNYNMQKLIKHKLKTIRSIANQIHPFDCWASAKSIVSYDGRMRAASVPCILWGKIIIKFRAHTSHQPFDYFIADHILIDEEETEKNLCRVRKGSAFSPFSMDRWGVGRRRSLRCFRCARIKFYMFSFPYCLHC